MANDLRERVLLELKLVTGSSVRRAAEIANRKAGKHVVSNQTLGRFLDPVDGGDVTPSVREGFAFAFDWGMDWPENPPPAAYYAEPTSTANALAEIRDELSALTKAVHSVVRKVSKIDTTVKSVDATVATVVAAVDRVEDTVPVVLEFLRHPKSE